MLTKLLNIVIKVKKVEVGSNGKQNIMYEFGGYKSFSKHPELYIDLVQKIYDSCISLEAVAVEAELVCREYLNLLIEKDKVFQCADFHRQIFVSNLLEEPLIKVKHKH